MFAISCFHWRMKFLEFMSSVSCSHRYGSLKALFMYDWFAMSTKHSPLLLLRRHMRHCQSDREQLKAEPERSSWRAIYQATVMTFLKYHFLKSNLYQHVHANGQTKRLPHCTNIFSGFLIDCLRARDCLASRDTWIFRVNCSDKFWHKDVFRQ